MDKLGVFDQLFYKADQHNVVSMIMGGASILAPARKNGRLKGSTIAGHLAARLGEIPLLRVRMVQDPVRLGSMHRVPDPDFDIDDHIDLVSLPSPGGYRELSECLAQLSQEPLELSRLWRWTVIEGLEGGRLAIYCKVHHALADGVGLMEVLGSIYDSRPVKPERPGAPKHIVADLPSPATLLGKAVTETLDRLWVKTPRFLLKNTGPILNSLGSTLTELRESWGEPDSRFKMAEVNSTSLNTTEYSGRRTVAWKTLSLQQVKALSRSLGCTVNDIGLFLFSSALQHYLDGIGEDIDGDLWCGMPMSVRSGAGTEGGNQITIGRLSLHNTIEDPQQRLAAIKQDAMEIKAAMRPEEPVVDMREIAELVIPGLLDATLYLVGKTNLMGRFGGSVAFINAVFSNVPGPPGKVYIGNAVQEESIPMIPAVDMLAVSGGITSVGDALTLGFHCDAGVVRKPELFIEGVEHGLATLIDISKHAGTGGVA